ncbi:MAG: glycosyl hydrolase family 18 protein [Vibrionaceae bacterium]
MQSKFKFSILGSCIAALLSFSVTAAPAHDKQVIGYLTQWEAWKGPEAGFGVKGEATHLNVDMNLYSILNFSFFGVAKDGSLHSGDYRNKNIYKPTEVQEPGNLLHPDVYSSWDLHILWGELEYVHSFPGTEAWEAEMYEKVTAQSFVAHGNGWLHEPSGVSGPLPIPLKKAGGAPGLIDLAHQNGVKVMASIGGWSMSKHFPEMAADPVKKARFLADIDRLLALGFDGIDIDWEYPGAGGMNFTGSDADYANFEQLMEDIRGKIGPDRLLTAAFKASKSALEGFNWPRLVASMDHFNMMTYDLNGGWSEITGHNSPLYPYPEEEFAELTIEDLRRWMVDEKGIPSEKINMGAAFYGRGVQTSESVAYLGAPTEKREVNFEVDGPGVSAVDLTNWGMFEGQPNYNYLIKQTNWQHMWDDNAKVPYAVKGKFFLSYDDPKAMREKAQYVVDNNLSGLIIWQVHGDIECKGSYITYGPKLSKCTNLSSPLAEAIDDVFSQNTLPNAAPVLTAPATVSVASGASVTFAVSATDADGDKLSFSATGAQIAELGNGQAQVTYQAPQTSGDRVEKISVAVSDGKITRTASIDVQIQGSGEEVNSAPVISVPASIDVTAGETAQISVSASDADNDPLTFSTTLGTIAQAGNSAVISVPTTLQDAGKVLHVAISVTDGQESHTASVAVNVKEEPAPSDSTWDANAVYNGGDKVTHNGIEYTAKWWTQGDEPGASDVWEEKADGTVKAWDAAKVYNGGDQATFQGNLYEAKWWTQGDEPGNPAGPWLLK